MYRKKSLIFAIVFSLLIPLTVFSIMDERGAFDTRSQAQSELLEEFKSADIDNNSRVDLSDFEGWLDMWKGYKANKSSYSRDGDLDEDGSIGISDFAMWLEQWRGYKEYTADPEGYIAQRPDGLVAGWSLDEHTGTGAYLSDQVSGEFNAMPIGTEIYSSGISGASRLMGVGDGFIVQNGRELPFGEGDYIMSFDMNFLDKSYYDLGQNPDAFVWDNQTEEFRIMSLRNLKFDYRELLAMFGSVDLEGMLMPESKGWFNMMAYSDSEKDIMEYFINGISIGSFDFSNYSAMRNYDILALLPEGNRTAFDNINAWGEDEEVDTETVYAITSQVYSPTSTSYTYSEIFSSPENESEDEPYYKDRNYHYNLLGYESRQCIVCSTDYEGVMAHYDVEGYEGTDYPSDSICTQAARSDGEYGIKSGSLYYTCSTRCGYVSSDYQPDGYPGDSGNVGSAGIDTRAEYLRCLDYVIAKSNKIEFEDAKECRACSTRYYHIVARWNGTCNESTDEERIAIDPNLIYYCMRCGSPPGDSNRYCRLGGYPSPNDEIFERHYATGYNPEWGNAYEIYMENCIGDREGCKSFIEETSKLGCGRCSSDFIYAYASWGDPGEDGRCLTDDDPYDTASYVCDCACTANLRDFTLNSQWSDSSYTSYQACKSYCESK